MQCPNCHRELSPQEIVHYRFRCRGMPEPVDMASLACGCQVRADVLNLERPATWETAARRRVDENLRSIFG